MQLEGLNFSWQRNLLEVHAHKRTFYSKTLWFFCRYLFIFIFSWLFFDSCILQVMKTYHMYHAESISAESKLKEAEKQEEKQIGRSGDPVFHIRLEERHQRRSSVKKIEKMKEKVNSHLI